MAERPYTTEQILGVITQTVARISELSNGLSEADLQASPASDSWSVRDVLAHLLSCSEVWGAAIDRIIAEDRPTFRAVSPRTWIRRTDLPTQDFAALFKAFTAKRYALIPTLQQLPAESWSRSATVTGAGRPLQQTVHSYAERLARHEREHTRQIEQIVTALHTTQMPSGSAPATKRAT